MATTIIPPDESDVDLLSEIPEVEEVEEAEEEESEESSEDEEEPEESEEESEEKKEEEKTFPYERPTIKDIKTKYPELFKDFPTLRDSIFREYEYTKLFPTIEDAKDAIDDNVAFNNLRDSVLTGDTEKLYQSINEADKSAAKKFAVNFLPMLYKQDQETYTTIIQPLFENLIRTVMRDQDENTRNAAVVISNWLWGSDGEHIAKGQKTLVKSTEETPEEKRIKQDRLAFEQQKYDDFHNTVIGEMTDGLFKAIIKGIDPDEVMSDYAKKTLARDVLREVDSAMAQDKNHMSSMNFRWLRTKKEGYNQASKEKLVSAYLSRAKQVMPSIRDRVRNDFLGTKKKAASKQAQAPHRERPISGRTVSAPKKESIDWRSTSDLDILNDKITLRK